MEIQNIKEELKEIQKNFNPTKETYKILEKIINNYHNATKIHKELLKIKGIDKYPETLKEKYFGIIASLQAIIKKEKEQQEENTRELQDLIKTLEAKKNTTKLQEIIRKPKEEQEILEKENIQEVELEILKKRNIQKVKSELTEKENNDKGRYIFVALLSLVIITLLIGILIFIYY